MPPELRTPFGNSRTEIGPTDQIDLAAAVVCNLPVALGHACQIGAFHREKSFVICESVILRSRVGTAVHSDLRIGRGGMRRARGAKGDAA